MNLPCLSVTVKTTFTSLTVLRMVVVGWSSDVFAAASVDGVVVVTFARAGAAGVARDADSGVAAGCVAGAAGAAGRAAFDELSDRGGAAGAGAVFKALAEGASGKAVGALWANTEAEANATTSAGK